MTTKKLLVFALSSTCLASNSEAGFPQTTCYTLPESKIDGNLTEWYRLPYHAINANASDELSFHGRFWKAWNQDGILIAADLLDDDPATSKSDKECDRVEIAIDLRSDSYSSKNTLARSDELILDKFEIQKSDGTSITIDDSDPSISYSNGEWHKQTIYSNSPYHSNTISRTAGTPGASASLTFEGTSIAVYGKRSIKNGFGRLLVDGKLAANFDAFSFGELEGTLLCRADNLTQGKHTVRVEVSSIREDSTAHLTVKRTSIGATAKLRTPKGNFSDSIKLSSSTNGSQWRFELLVPWNLLTTKSKAQVDEMRLGFEIFDYDPPKRRATSSYGITRQSDQLSLEWLQKNGDRFGIYHLSSDTPNFGYDFRTEETLENGKRLTRIQLYKLNNPSLEDSKITINDSTGTRHTFNFRPSSYNGFQYIDEYIPSLQKFGNEPYVVQIGEDSIEAPIFERENWDSILRRIEQSIPEKEIQALTPYKQAIVSLLKSSSIEISRFLGLRPYEEINHYHEFALYTNKRLVNNTIETYLEHAQLWLKSDRTELEAQRYSVQPWRSRIDNTWQFFTVHYPDNYNPKEKYPIIIDFHFQNKKQFSRLFFLMKELGANGSIQHTASNPDNVIWITPSGRGNAFQGPADEELDQIFEWIEANLENNYSEIRLSGISVGGHTAIQYAIQNMNNFDLLDISSATVQKLTPSSTQQDYDDITQYENFAFSYRDKWQNFMNFPIRVSIGKLDRGYFFDNLFFSNRLSKSEWGCQLDIHPNHGHGIRFGEKFPLKILPKTQDRIKDSHKWIHYSLRFSQLHETTVLSKIRAYGSCSVERILNTQEETLQYELKNVRRLAIDLTKIPEIKELNVNETRLQSTEIYSDKIILSSQDGRNYELDKTLPTICKHPGQQGPISDIEQKPFVIVFGTLDPALTPYLKERAYRIARQKRGSAIGQFEAAAIRVYSDTEYLKKQLSNVSIWSIGDSKSNAVTKSLSQKISFTAKDLLSEVLTKSTDRNSVFTRVLLPMPDDNANYLLIESGQTPAAFSSPISQDSQFDFSIRTTDGLKNNPIARGLLSDKWDLTPRDSIVWKGSTQ